MTYSETASCADIALSISRIYIADTLDRDALIDLTDKGIERNSKHGNCYNQRNYKQYNSQSLIIIGDFNGAMQRKEHTSCGQITCVCTHTKRIFILY